MELASLRPLIPQEDREKAMQRMADKSAMSDTRNEDPEADLAEKVMCRWSVGSCQS